MADLVKIEKGLPTTDRVAPERKTLTSREITVKFNLKKVLLPGLVIVALAVAAVIIFWRVLPKKEAVSAKAAAPSIAVLPFVDDSPEKGNAYLCEGIPNTLINALNTIRDLRVPARTSAFSFAGKGLDIQAIGQKLNVENVLEGSVQVVGNNLPWPMSTNATIGTGKAPKPNSNGPSNSIPTTRRPVSGMANS